MRISAASQDQVESLIEKAERLRQVVYRILEVMMRFEDGKFADEVYLIRKALLKK
jgi:hypothetical protein